MPPQHGLGLDKQQSVTPAWGQSGQQYHQASLVGLEHRPLQVARSDDQLLAKQGVLGNELAPSPQDIARQTGDHWQRVDETPQGDLDSCCQTGDQDSKPLADRRYHDLHDVCVGLANKACSWRRTGRSCGGCEW
jgi:hypothetical protein